MAEAKDNLKPGFKTTEFWLSLLAMVLGVILSSGALNVGGLAAQVVGGAMSILGALGYTVSRAGVKKSQNALEAVKDTNATAVKTADPTKGLDSV